MTGVSRRRLWFAVFVVLIFALGVTTGIVGTRHLRWGRGPGPGGRGGPGGPGGPGRPTVAQVMDRMTVELGLSPQQRVNVEHALSAGTARMDAFQNRTRQEFDALRQHMNAEIEQILTPDQRLEFRKRLPPPRPPS